MPVDACTLPTAEQFPRIAEFAALFTTALRGQERRGPGWLRLVLAADGNADGEADGDVEATVRGLIARESACCSFFDFHLTPSHTDGNGDGDAGEDRVLVLDVRVLDAGVDVLDGLAHQARAHQARAHQARAHQARAAETRA